MSVNRHIPLLTLNNIGQHCVFQNESIETLNNIHLNIGQGEFLAITGPAGSGKSALLHIIGCLKKTQQGQYLLLGESIHNQTEKQLTHTRSKHIGWVFSNSNLIDRYSVLKNSMHPLSVGLWLKQNEKKRARFWLNFVGLNRYAGHRPPELSKVQQQQLAIARAMARNPTLLLVDDPTENLSDNDTAQIMRLFKKLNQYGQTIVLATRSQMLASQCRRQIHLLNYTIHKDIVHRPLNFQADLRAYA